MSNIIKSIYEKYRLVRAHPSDSKIKAALEDVYDLQARQITKRFARGNVLLQEGRYVTAKQIDDEFGEAPWRKPRD